MIAEVALEGLEFFAYHGFYTEERKIGNKYGIDLVIKVEVPDDLSTDDLNHTIDYEKVYSLVKTQMDNPTKLLETIAYKLANSILINFETALVVRISVSKFNPPVGGICQKASVTLVKSK